MKLSELLAYTAKEYLDDRTDLLDGEPDELWSDETLVRYFNAAEQRLARRAWALIDIGHSQAGIIVLATGKATYKLHKSILAVLDATPTTDEVPLTHMTDAQLSAQRPPDIDYWDVNRSSVLKPGAPLAISTDAGTRLLRVSPTPAAAQNGLKVVLKVARLPVCPLSLEDTGTEPEVDEQWHLDVLCKYAAGRALTHPNVDASAKTEGRTLLAEVEATIREARQERERFMAAPPRYLFNSATAAIR